MLYHIIPFTGTFSIKIKFLESFSCTDTLSMVIQFQAAGSSSTRH